MRRVQWMYEIYLYVVCHITGTLKKGVAILYCQLQKFCLIKKVRLRSRRHDDEKKTQLTWEKISDLGDIQHQCHELGGLFYEDSIRIKEGNF